MAIEAAINANPPVFQNPALIAQLDVKFANRYFAALNAYFHPSQYPTISQCWKVALDAVALPSPIIVQQLGVAMSAHIGLDLGVASAEVSVNETDFNEVNEVLNGQVMTVVAEIDALSPVLEEIEAVLGKYEIDLIDAALDFTRVMAWDFVVDLESSPSSEWPELIAAQDASAAGVGNFVLNPPSWIADVIAIIAKQENRDVDTIINTLNGGQ